MKNSSQTTIDTKKKKEYVDIFLSIVSENIKSFRQLKGMSQEELVKKSGISRDVISRIENAKNIGLDSLISIANVLGISPSALFTTKEEKEGLETFIKRLPDAMADIQKRLANLEKK